ncbi:MAG TPA: maleylpyruvate isomerase N-terminal domain-containing protein, partial [Sporichthya sp.]|nr:maleylpyruvate isomerase N-terminal domain-containing protein [Sporichthya sp.]
MIDLHQALDRADAGFDVRVRQVGDADWTLPTPCAEWNVYRLVNHVVIGGGRYARLVRGGTRDDFIAER